MIKQMKNTKVIVKKIMGRILFKRKWFIFTEFFYSIVIYNRKVFTYY